ncbi:hypothetical protein RKE29_03740 [Streptomyces sp. B1866]|uniref:hypothetical protein n=1 Tax=Streptomyces sp. B1866 TaxID=3075431 RepID=UPI00288F2C0A|nr:hypothetical protein [Streptomyces sp. B1866]MDT3395768.1 hypothetical protein [Streptomyces sp. B1866]
MPALPRPFADLSAYLHALAATPRPVLLARCHHQWTGAALLALLAVPALFGHRPDPLSTALVLPLAAASWALDLAGAAAHAAWERGRLWADVSCPCCAGPGGHGPHGGGPDDDPPLVPAAPAGGGLTAADLAWLDAVSRLPHPAPTART